MSPGSHQGSQGAFPSTHMASRTCGWGSTAVLGAHHSSNGGLTVATGVPLGLAMGLPFPLPLPIHLLLTLPLPVHFALQLP